MTVPRDADVVIVGAGAAGSTIAARLAEGGKRVVVFEAGPGWKLADLASSQLWARRLKWGGAPVEFRGNHRGFGHNLNTGWGKGGAALHHYATWPRLTDDVFRVHSKFGRGFDWPIDGDALRPWYDRVQADVGVSGDAAREPWRPAGAPYPLPPQQPFAQARMLQRGWEALGLAVAPLPAAILTAEYRGRPPCLYDGWCDAGCPIGALANPLITALPRAEKAGAEVVSQAMVTRIVPASSTRAGWVEWVDARGTPHRLDAAHVVLAGSGVQNPRLMLASASREWPGGLGNARDQVGRNFMLDAVALNYGLFDEATENYLGVSAGQLLHRARYGERKDAPFGSWHWQIAPALKPNDIFGIAVTRADLFGSALHEFMATAAQRMANQVAMIGQLPAPDNRVVLSAKRDRFGVPLARVEHRFDDESMALWRYVGEEGKRAMRAAGASETWTGPFNAGHLYGGTIMGGDPAHSVAAADTRVHGFDNVWLTGSGLFPASGGTSPTFTVVALAERTAAALLRY